MCDPVSGAVMVAKAIPEILGGAAGAAGSAAGAGANAIGSGLGAIGGAGLDAASSLMKPGAQGGAEQANPFSTALQSLGKESSNPLVSAGSDQLESVQSGKGLDPSKISSDASTAALKDLLGIGKKQTESKESTYRPVDFKSYMRAGV